MNGRNRNIQYSDFSNGSPTFNIKSQLSILKVIFWSSWELMLLNDSVTATAVGSTTETALKWLLLCSFWDFVISPWNKIEAVLAWRKIAPICIPKMATKWRGLPRKELLLSVLQLAQSFFALSLKSCSFLDQVQLCITLSDSWT